MARRRSLSSSPVAISEAVIGTTASEALRTGRAQTIADSRCRGLRLFVRPSEDPIWLLFCYGSDGKLEKRALGAYPGIGVDDARKRAWQHRLQVKGFARPRWHYPGITLEKLFMLYEDSCKVSDAWGLLKNRVFFALKPFVFRSWTGLSRRRLQKYIDDYESPGNMHHVVDAVNKVVTWAEESGILHKSSEPLAPPIARSRRDLHDGVPAVGRGVQRVHVTRKHRRRGPPLISC